MVSEHNLLNVVCGFVAVLPIVSLLGGFVLQAAARRAEKLDLNIAAASITIGAHQAVMGLIVFAGGMLMAGPLQNKTIFLRFLIAMIPIGFLILSSLISRFHGLPFSKAMKVAFVYVIMATVFTMAIAAGVLGWMKYSMP